jgi:hypothetical protein
MGISKRRGCSSEPADHEQNSSSCTRLGAMAACYGWIVQRLHTTYHSIGRYSVLVIFYGMVEYTLVFLKYLVGSFTGIYSDDHQKHGKYLLG